MIANYLTFNEMNKEQITRNGVIIILLLSALLLRVHDLDRESLFMDEIRQVAYYKAPFSQIIQHAASQQQPPLDYWIGHFVSRYSESDIAARLPAALFGTASIFLLFILMSRVCSFPVALFFSLFMALLPFHIFYSQEARPYTIALFFCLAFVLMLEKVLLRRESGILPLILLSLACTLFLLSRTLFPLCMVAVSVFLVVLYSAPDWGRTENWFTSRHTRILMSLSLALLIYLPVLSGILGVGQAYLDRDEAVSVWQSAMNLSFFPLWQSFAAQFEPMHHVMLLLVLLAFASLCPGSTRKGHQSARFFAYLLVLTALLNITIFSLKSSSPFRPPYGFYIMPLSLLLAAYAVEVIREKLIQLWGQRHAHYVLSACALALLISTVNTLDSFKDHQAKTDWRGLAEYSRMNFSEKDVVVFDSLSKSHHWKPYFYGFYRYPAGSTNFLSSKDLARGIVNWKSFSHRAVLVLFYYRDYRLWSSAEFVLMSKLEGTPAIDINEITQDPLLETHWLNGLLVITSKEKDQGFIKGAYLVHSRILPHIEETSALVDHLLSLASLAAVCERDSGVYQAYIEKANSLSEIADRDHIQQVSDVIAKSRSIFEEGVCD